METGFRVYAGGIGAWMRFGLRFEHMSKFGWEIIDLFFIMLLDKELSVNFGGEKGLHEKTHTLAHLHMHALRTVYD